jgi:hypothetical protein
VQVVGRRNTWRRLLLAGALVLPLAVSACARQAVSTRTTLPGGAAAPTVGDGPLAVGATTGRGAIEAFMKAVNGQDLQAMSGLWGNTKGLARDQFKRDELEKRLIVLQCLMQHDTMTFPEDRGRLQTGGRQEFLVELRKGQAMARTTIMTVAGPDGRWLVEDVDVTKLTDFCR